MFVIIEGIDGSGKSTLSKELEYIGAVKIAGENRLNEDSISEFLERIKYLSTLKTIYFCDRSFISDIIYRYFDQKTPAKYTLEDLYKFCKYTNVIVYCKSTTSYDNAIKRGEDNIVCKGISNQLSMYYDFVISIIERYNICKIINYDYNVNNNYEQIYKIITQNKED